MKRWMQAALVVGVALRVLLALVNTDANDNHLAVVEIIAQEHRLPERTETFQAYHPPLYHATAALLWNLAPTDSQHVRIRLAQLLIACFCSGDVSPGKVGMRPGELRTDAFNGGHNGLQVGIVEALNGGRLPGNG